MKLKDFKNITNENAIDYLLYDFKEECLGIKETLKGKTYIQRFLIYRKYNNPKVKYDCDKSKLAKEILKEVYFNINNIKTRGRYFILEDNIMLETDTMCSVATLLNPYVRRNIKESSMYGYNEDTIKNIENWLKDCSKEIVSEFSLLCRLTHTIGNFILVPYKFNSYRGFYDSSNLKDFWDLSLEFLKNNSIDYLCSEIDANNEKVRKSLEYYKNNIKQFDEVSLYCNHEYGRPLPNNNQLLECLKNMNNSIVKRGIILLKILNTNLQIDEKNILREIRK